MWDNLKPISSPAPSALELKTKIVAVYKPIFFIMYEATYPLINICVNTSILFAIHLSIYHHLYPASRHSVPTPQCISVQSRGATVIAPPQ